MMQYENILENDEIKLRALEPEDISLLYVWENDTKLWEVGSTIAPFSKKLLRDYIENSHLDIYEAKQLRLMIDDKQSQTTIGSIDLYDFDPHNRRAGIGILVTEEFQNKGFAKKSLQILLHYCKLMLLLHQVYVEIPKSNEACLALFRSADFQQIGIKKDWLARGHEYEDVVVMQKLL